MEKIKIGIVGAGSRGVCSFGRLLTDREDCQVAAFTDLNMARMEAAREYLRNNDIALYRNIDKMLQEAEMDAIIVTSIDSCHKEHITAALRAGYNVLTDKPLAIKTVDCLEILKVAEETGNEVNLGFNLRSHVVCRKIKELVDTGTIGRIVTIEEREYYSGGRTYFSRWNRFYDKSGGLFCHKGSHDFDIINWLNPGALPVKVSAFAGINVFNPEGLPFSLEAGEKAGPYCEICQVRHKCKDCYDLSREFAGFRGAARAEDGYHKDTCMYLSEKNTHDNGIAMIEYDNGVRAIHSENFISPVSDRLFTIVGDKGHLDATLDGYHLVIHPRWTEDKIEYRLQPPVGEHGGADPVMVDKFVENLKTPGRTTLATAREGAMSVLIGEAAERSRREERTVKIQELISSDDLAKIKPFQ